MSDDPADLGSRLASRDIAALEEVWDLHARSVHGYALYTTRNRADARRVSCRTLATLAAAPERISHAGEMRRVLLGIARSQAIAERSRRGRFRWLLLRSSRALDPASPPDLLKAADSAPDAEDIVLHATEGLYVSDLHAPQPVPARPSASWSPCPWGLKALALMHGREAMFPARRWVRWSLLWATVPASLLLAVAADSRRPTLPDVKYLPPPGAYRSIPDSSRKRDLLDILDAFRQEKEGK